MTREEAIEEIKNYNKNYPSGLSKECRDYIIKALEQEPCEDAVSRKAVRDTIFAECSGAKLDIDFAKILLLQRAIKTLPSVTPQEQFKPIIEIDLDYVIKQKYIEREVLDKIRAEILEETEYAYSDFKQYKIDYLGVDAEYVEDELPDDDFRYGMERCIEIINKYKAESEEK